MLTEAEIKAYTVDIPNDIQAARRASGCASATCSAAGLVARINEYLQLGGLFNPEMMEHDKMRNLLLDCREALSQQQNDQAQTPPI